MVKAEKRTDMNLGISLEDIEIAIADEQWMRIIQSVAVDFYYFEEDLALMGEMVCQGIPYFIGWTRIFLANGDETEPNEAGLAFYDGGFSETVAQLRH